MGRALGVLVAVGLLVAAAMVLLGQKADLPLNEVALSAAAPAPEAPAPRAIPPPAVEVPPPPVADVPPSEEASAPEPPLPARKGRVLVSGSAPRHLLPGGAGEVRLVLEDTPEAAVSTLRLLPQAAVPEHTHSSAEILYLEEGAVRVTLDGEDHFAKGGDVVYIPAGVRHSARVVSRNAVRALQVYVPPGPEQRFKQPAP